MKRITVAILLLAVFFLVSSDLSIATADTIYNWSFIGNDSQISDGTFTVDVNNLIKDISGNVVSFGPGGNTGPIEGLYNPGTIGNDNKFYYSPPSPYLDNYGVGFYVGGIDYLLYYNGVDYTLANVFYTPALEATGNLNASPAALPEINISTLSRLVLLILCVFLPYQQRN